MRTTQEVMDGRRARSGFTMLELVMAVALLSLLIGGVFTMAQNMVALGNSVVERQSEVSEQTAFFDLLRNQLGGLPGNTRMELAAQDSGAQYLSDLTLQNVPMTFNWGGMERVAKAVQLSTVRRRDGLLDIVLRYYEDSILDETSEVGETPNRFGDFEPFAEVVLMEDVFILEWRALDGRTMEWSYDWDLTGRLPLQLELIFVKDQIDADTPIRQVFWIPPRQNPAVLMRQLQQQGQQNPAGGAVTGGRPDGNRDPAGRRDPRNTSGRGDSRPTPPNPQIRRNR